MWFTFGINELAAMQTLIGSEDRPAPALWPTLVDYATMLKPAVVLIPAVAYFCMPGAGLIGALLTSAKAASVFAWAQLLLYGVPIIDFTGTAFNATSWVILQLFGRTWQATFLHGAVVWSLPSMLEAFRETHATDPGGTLYYLCTRAIEAAVYTRASLADAIAGTLSLLTARWLLLPEDGPIRTIASFVAVAVGGLASHFYMVSLAVILAALYFMWQGSGLFDFGMSLVRKDHKRKPLNATLRFCNFLLGAIPLALRGILWFPLAVLRALRTDFETATGVRAAVTEAAGKLRRERDDSDAVTTAFDEELSPRAREGTRRGQQDR